MPHPLGAEDLRQPRRGRGGRCPAMRSRRPTMSSAIVKLERGRLRRRQRAGRPARAALAGRRRRRREAVRQRLRDMQLESPDTPYDVVRQQVRRGRRSSRSGSSARRCAARACSCGCCPAAAVELLSTHDQLLGGASGQSYLGCVFPADPGYARLITQHAETIGAPARGDGRPRPVRGRLRGGPRRRGRLDAVRDRAEPAQGRHHPPVPDPAVPHRRPLRPRHALFLTPRGHEKHLVATDHLESDLLRALVPADLFDIVARHGLHFDQSRQDGRGVPHDQLADRARPGRADRRRRHPRGGGAPLPAGRAGAAGGGDAAPDRDRPY